MNSVERGLKRLYQRIKTSAYVDERGLSAFRVMFGLFNLLFIQHFAWIAEAPGSFYSPPIWSIASFFPGFLPGWIFQAFDILLVILLVFVTLGIKTRLSAFSTFLLLIFAQSFHYSFGKIDHGILLTLTFLVIAFANSGTIYALVKDSRVSDGIQRFSLSIFAVFVAFGMFTAGFPKMISWIDFDLSTSGILHWYYPGYYSLERTHLLAPWVPYIPMLIMEMGDYFAVALEISGLFFLIKGRFHWMLWMVILSFFHLLNVLILNIPFIGHIAVYGVFLFPAFYTGAIKDGASSITKAVFLTVTLSLALYRLFERFTGRTPALFVDETVWAILLWICTFLLGISILLKPKFRLEQDEAKKIEKKSEGLMVEG